LHQGTHKVLRHGSHSFTCKQHHACLSFVAFTRCHHHSNWGSRHPIAAHYSFIDPERMKGWVVEPTPRPQPIKPSRSAPVFTRIPTKFTPMVSSWSRSYRLKLNAEKSEVIWLGTRQQLSSVRQTSHCSYLQWPVMRGGDSSQSRCANRWADVLLWQSVSFLCEGLLLPPATCSTDQKIRRWRSYPRSCARVSYVPTRLL